MNNLRYIGFIYFVFTYFNSVVQTYTYTEKLDWVIGEYQGLSKDSTANSIWGSVVMDIYYSNDYGSLDDSTIVCTYFNLQHIISDDSTASDHRKAPDHFREREDIISFEKHLEDLRKEMNFFLAKHL